MHNLYKNYKFNKSNRGYYYMNAINLDQNFGKLAVDLGLEEKVLANGILPERSVPERSDVVTGMVHHLLKNGDWRKAIGLRFGEARHLYDPTKGNFHSDILQAIKPEDFNVKENGFSDEGGWIGNLLQHGEREIVQDLAKNFEIPVAIVGEVTEEGQSLKVDLEELEPPESDHIIKALKNLSSIDM